MGVDPEMLEVRDPSAASVVPSVMTDSPLVAVARRQLGPRDPRSGARGDVREHARAKGAGETAGTPSTRRVPESAGHPTTWEQDLLAACLAAGPDVRACPFVRPRPCRIRGLPSSRAGDHELRWASGEHRRGHRARDDGVRVVARGPDGADPGHVRRSHVVRSDCDRPSAARGASRRRRAPPEDRDPRATSKTSRRTSKVVADSGAP